MSTPTKYTRSYSFSGYQATNPSQPLPAPQVDNELENIEQSLGEAIDAVNDVRRADGALVNGIVTLDSLADEVRDDIGEGATASAAAAAASAVASANSAIASEDSADASASSATAAANSAAAAQGSANSAAAARNAAENARDDAIVMKNGADEARDFAAQWASAPENTPVDDGVNPVGKSAYHWAKAAEATAGGAIPNGAVTEPKLSADVAGKLNGALQAGNDLSDLDDVGTARKNIGLMDTLASAIADAPAVDPEYYDIAYYDTAYQTGSGAKYRKVATEPSHAGKFQNANGAWYEIAAGVVRPEMFGRIGVNAAGDTAAWVALAGYSANRVRVVVEASGEYLIAGSDVKFDSVGYLKLNLWGAIFRQQSQFSTTIWLETCGWTEVFGGKFYGLGGDGGEWEDIDGNSVTWLGVAAIYSRMCQSSEYFGVQCYDHAGGNIFNHGTIKAKAHWCKIVGIGPDYVDPLDNGSYFGIMNQPYSNDQGWVFEYDFQSNDISDCSSGIQVVMTKRCVIKNNEISALGEHCVYGIELDGLDVRGNHFHDAPMFAFKNQLENYAGLYVWPDWQATHAYVVGDIVKKFSVAWRCVTAHTSGATFASDNWEIDASYYRNGGFIEDNRVERCGYGIGSTAATAAQELNTWINNLFIRGNTILDSVHRGLSLDRMVGCHVKNNTILRSGEEGIYGIDWSGYCEDNTVEDCGFRGILLTIAFGSFFARNRLTNCGLAGTDDAEKAPIVLHPPAATGIPSQEANPQIYFDENGFFYPTGDAAGPYLLYASDPRLTFKRIRETYGTTTTKVFRVDGAVERTFRNHFPGYYNTAQNPKTITVTNPLEDREFDPSTATVGEISSVVGTLIADLQANYVEG